MTFTILLANIVGEKTVASYHIIIIEMIYLEIKGCTKGFPMNILSLMNKSKDIHNYKVQTLQKIKNLPGILMCPILLEKGWKRNT